MEIRKIKLPFRIKNSVLALGSQTKNTVCFVKDNRAYLSPVFPDLSRPEDLLNFEKAVKYFLAKKPKIIAYDLHPEYQSTKFALSELNAKRYTLYAIQHHHAHIASCMLENELKNQKVIGVAFDGTGLGIDNRFWGAEFLVCDYKSFQRKGHLKEVPLLGAEKAITEPYRLTLIWLYLIYKEKFLNLKIDFVKGIDKKKWRILKNIYAAKFNSPIASSMGRLFDAVASLILVKYKASYEAELAMELEKIAMAGGYRVEGRGYRVQSYEFKIIKQENKYIIDPLPMFKQIIQDIRRGAPKEEMAYKFHLTVAQMIKKICLVIRKESKINRVVLSGGVFQNKLLLGLGAYLLCGSGFQVIKHRELPFNDSSVSLGQAVIAGYSRGVIR